MDDRKKGSFDKLVAGLSSEDRNSMLESIKRNPQASVTLVETEPTPPELRMSLVSRLKSESLLYRIILFIKGFIYKKTTEKVYNEEVIARIARKVNRDHPGLVSHRHGILDSVFYEQLKGLKECSDFFKPYILLIDDNPGDFYVFLSSFVAPELAEFINSEADPFILPFGQEPTIEIKSELLKKLDDILKDIDGKTKANLYAAVSGINWLKQFTKLPFIHFSAQFTNVAGNSYTCPYTHARTDFNEFAAVFGNVRTIDAEVLQALYLFSQRKNFNKNVQNKDIEKAVREFMAKANGYLGTIEMFIAGVPCVKIGKIVNADYDWMPANIEGAEAWFPSFRSQWKKIFDIRWNEWIRERKKYKLSNSLQMDFKLSEFPMMKYRPWGALWNQVNFCYELTGGFIGWFSEEMFPDMITPLNEVMMEGVFIRSENRTEYSEGLDCFVRANNQMLNLLTKLSPDGDFGKVFADFAENRLRTLQVQNQIDSMMRAVQESVNTITNDFAKGCRAMERVFHGFFDEQKDGIHETLQNLTTIKGHLNRDWRDKIMGIRETLKKCIFYIGELEPIDTATKNE